MKLLLLATMLIHSYDFANSLTFFTVRFQTQPISASLYFNLVLLYLVAGAKASVTVITGVIYSDNYFEF